MKYALVSVLALVALGAYWTTRADEPTNASGGVDLNVATQTNANTTAEGGQNAAKNAGASADVDVRLDAATRRIAELEAEVSRLCIELDVATKARLARESEFLRYTQGIAQLSSLAGSPIPHFETDALAEAASAAKKAEALAAERRALDEKRAASASNDSTKTTAAVPPPAHATDKDGAKSPTPIDAASPELSPARGHAVYQELRTLFTLEQITGFDLLEVGVLHQGYTGPVVLRVLDDRGRPLGVLAADRLRLEASRAAHMVTVVLENGCERRAGVKTPFDGGPVDADGRGGVRRIALSECDPKPWIEAVPELFRNEDRDTSIDDGRTKLVPLRAALNQLLHVDGANGWYRVQGIGGVQANVLRDVAIDQLDHDGKIERRLFADRMSIVREAQGLQILLLGGSQVRGDQKSAFLDGRYRIFLPRADVEAWTKAKIPGLDAITSDDVSPARDKPLGLDSAHASPKSADSNRPATLPAEPARSPQPK